MPFHRIKNWLFHFFHFNKQERNGVFILCIIISALIILKFLLPFLTDRNNKIELITLNVLPDKFKEDKVVEDSHYSNYEKDNTASYSAQRFVFNPNTVSEKDLQALGFSKKLSSTFIKFRSKGGKFYKPEDLKKLYGLSPKLYDLIEPYILIPNNKKDYKKDSAYTHPVYEKKFYVKNLTEINTADSLSIVYLKGIGPGFTKRIIKYRTLLGGFFSVSQLKEVWGMTDSTFSILSPQITLNPEAIIKIPINAVDLNTLKKHPYFNYQSAQAVINYREKHGKFTAETLKNVGVFSDEKLQTILPYMSY